MDDATLIKLLEAKVAALKHTCDERSQDRDSKTKLYIEAMLANETLRRDNARLKDQIDALRAELRAASAGNDAIDPYVHGRSDLDETDQ